MSKKLIKRRRKLYKKGQWRRQLWGTGARAPLKFEKAKNFSDEIIWIPS